MDALIIAPLGAYLAVYVILQAHEQILTKPVVYNLILGVTKKGRRLAYSVRGIL
jgi:hypothetical protein